MMADSRQGVRLSQTSPAFLHANSTSHTWPFSAFAEIIDNAYDPDVAASQLYIDMETNHGQKFLVFMDNGNGMGQDKLHKMLSFGYCEKVEVDGHKPVGHYGNGFKSGSMRLGRDAIVFTKTKETMSVGLLSQSYLDKIKATTVLIPMVTWNTKTKKIVDDSSIRESLQAITQHSNVYKTEQDLLLEFREMDVYTSGTRILIYDLQKGNDGKLELDFESNPKDIINSETMALDFSSTLRPVKEHVAEYKRSLREYCSILFLKPRMKIILRGQKVKTKLISRSLSRTEKDYYKPVFLPKPVKIILGFSDSVEDFGLMMYHRNRLIKAYEHVGCQKQSNDHGVGIVGVVEVDFLDPIHNKQDFNKTDRYNACTQSLGQKLSDYWYTKTQTQDERNSLNERRKADWTWVQCENCLKWRRLPDGFTDEGLPEKWCCYMNSDPTHNRCDIDEEPEDEDELQARATYTKVKKKTDMRKTELSHREQIIVQKEQQLLTMQHNLEQSLEPLAPPGSQGHRPTVADFEAAQKKLQLAKQREEHQAELIKRLQENRKEMISGQIQMRHNMAQNSTQDMLKNIANSGQSNGVGTPKMTKKKKVPTATFR